MRLARAAVASLVVATSSVLAAASASAQTTRHTPPAGTPLLDRPAVGLKIDGLPGGTLAEHHGTYVFLADGGIEITMHDGDSEGSKVLRDGRGACKSAKAGALGFHATRTDLDALDCKQSFVLFAGGKKGFTVAVGSHGTPTREALSAAAAGVHLSKPAPPKDGVLGTFAALGVELSLPEGWKLVEHRPFEVRLSHGSGATARLFLDAHPRPDHLGGCMFDGAAPLESSTCGGGKAHRMRLPIGHLYVKYAPPKSGGEPGLAELRAAVRRLP